MTHLFTAYRPRASADTRTVVADPTRREPSIGRLARAIANADAIVVGAGSGLSTSAGLSYSGERFDAWFSDFRRARGIRDMYSGGFYPYPTANEYWAFWSRHVYCNRYDMPPNRLYRELVELLRGREHFVVTTNVDHQFQLAGIDRDRLFYTQGDYGLFQCSGPCHLRTYDNEREIRTMIAAQGFEAGPSGAFMPSSSPRLRRLVPSTLLPRCPRCGRPMTMNLRCDGTFVEDEGWHAAESRYWAFLDEHEQGRVLYLELGVGANTPTIIKYPFWQRTSENPNAAYACINLGESYCPSDIGDRCILIDADIAQVLDRVSGALAGTETEALA